MANSLSHLPDQAGQLVGDTVDWVTRDSSAAFTAIAVAVALYAVFWGLRWAASQALGPSRDVATWRGFAGRLVRRTHSFFIAALAAWAVTHFVAPPGPLLRTIDILFTIAAAVQGAAWTRAVALGLVERRASHAEDAAGLASAMNIIRVLINFVVWFLALILVLSNLGVNVTALVAGLGVGGIAIGLAAQGIFADLFAALAILFDRPFSVGDTISFGNVTGSVEAIGLKTTRIRALSGEQVIVSNTNLLNQQISNLARVQERRVVMTIGVIYQTPPELLARIPEEIRAIIAARPKCRFDRSHQTIFNSSSIDFETVYYISDPGFVTMLDERQAINLALLARFNQLGVAFAYPTQTSFTATPDGQLVDPRERLPGTPPPEPRANGVAP